jgi:hypothetical protein
MKEATANALILSINLHPYIIVLSKMISRGALQSSCPTGVKSHIHLVKLSEKSRGADRSYVTNELDFRLRYAGYHPLIGCRRS